MKKYLTLFVLMLCVVGLASQEICDNGIDDDGDGDIDMNDDACICVGLTLDVNSIITNESFEEYKVCPDQSSHSLDLADDWQQATKATTDYLNNCGFIFSSVMDIPKPMLHGEACTGILVDYFRKSDSQVVQEYLGSNLADILKKGVSYTLRFYVGFGKSNYPNEIKERPFSEFSLYGSSKKENFPLNTWQCPLTLQTPDNSWRELGKIRINRVTGKWIEASITFNSNEDIYSIMLGGTCTSVHNEIPEYVFIDKLDLSRSDNFKFNAPTSTGSTCEGTYVLHAEDVSIIASYQWYRNGVAIRGEDRDSIVLGNALNRDGEYTVRLEFGGECILSEPTIVHSVDNEVNIKGNSYICEEIGSTTLSASRDYIAYHWNNGKETKSIDVSSVGSYILEAQINETCSRKDTFEVTDIIKLKLSGIVDNPTYGQADGSIIINASGGSGQYTFEWKDGISTKDRMNMPKGTYTLVVTDISGCSDEITFNLNDEATKLEARISASDVTCNGGNSGSISVAIKGGIPPYIVEWEHTQSTSSFLTNVPAGTYGGVVKDQSEQEVLIEVTVNEPEEMKIHAGVSHVLCNGSETGEININVEGRNPDEVQYSWDYDQSQTSSYVNAMSAGDYSVTVTDKNGCTTSQLIEILEPEPLEFELEVHDNRCFGEPDGRIVLSSVTGGTPPYHFFLNQEKINTGAFNVKNLTAGSYDVMIKDDNNCDNRKKVTILKQDSIYIELVASSDSISRGDEVTFNFNVYPKEILRDNLFILDSRQHLSQDCEECNKFSLIPYVEDYFVLTMSDGVCDYYSNEIYINIIEDKFFIPSAFTPNGDRINDVFTFYTNKNEEIFIESFSIYSEQGQLIHHESDIHASQIAGWDGGKFNSGTFIYSIVTVDKFGTKEYYRGIVNLLNH